MSGPILHKGTPQWCILPLLYHIYAHNCIASCSSTSIIRFADDTAVLGLITDNNEQGYLNLVADLAPWCKGNHTPDQLPDFVGK